ncbi:MAG: efflux RND transporter periplasmic adaptor subunit [Deltaproteobacteria bacterium]|nr:efflux RND transporter periplasmic adaptor subunit [Candidatus Tharpella aukensis]
MKKTDMKNIEKKQTLSWAKIIALITIFSVLSLSPQTLWAQESNKHDHHQDADKHNHDDHQDCNLHDQHSEEKHDDHSNCNHGHDHASPDPGLLAASIPESCPDSVVSMLAAEMKRFGIVVEKATTNNLEVSVKVRGEITLNSDRTAHIVPRVSGIVLKVYRTLGDFVEKGGVMAIIESRELADAKTDYLSVIKHLELAEIVFKREKKLRRKKVSSEQDHLAAKQAFAETEITLKNCEQRLKILGFNKTELKKLSSEPATELSRFAVRSPFTGHIIKKDIALGEVITDTKEIFVVADLTTVWVDLDLYRKDADSVKKGQKVFITLPSQRRPLAAVIDYVAPLVDESTRTTMARVIINNEDEVLRPGTFITAEIVTKEIAAGVVVDRDILQEVGGQTCVFVQDEHGFEPRPVRLGETNARKVEIIAGLSPGELVVVKNGFRLKAALETGVGSGCGTPGHIH